MQNTYLAKRERLENYFNEVSSDAWDKLTSNEPVSFVRQLVREGREKMQLAIMEKLPKDLTGLRVLDDVEQEHFLGCLMKEEQRLLA